MYKGTLKRLSSNHAILRTDEVKGEFPRIPKIGDIFVMFSKPLTEGASVRSIQTTKISEVELIENGLRFKTRNSHYELIYE